ncbi:TetR/AcrR family transcriptional regulator [Marinobacterium arenosum]|uniref:TetR/AcrR family transcriptional regulator n=1 Tax=Marinobacterium arenosum TaxID=2862496 RepID=UPI001C955CB6|nr:TetR/AcrR family transcriptional regulator [Marinobacterium arenosum]MBY4678497.1 TetR/AcrR family transcriptional regulator [Marinobacterium arenosum]
MARPAEFDRDEVLDKAMEAFWRTGFNATSVADLVNVTRLKPGSLYSAFASKRGLFIEVLDTYAARRIEGVKQVLDRAEDPLMAIRDMMHRFVADLSDDKIGRGCLMVNTMTELATEDDEIRERVSNYLDQVEQYVHRSLELAQQQGQLRADADTDTLAKMLMTTIWGMRIMSSKRPDPASYHKVIDHLLNTLPTS